MEIEVVLKSCLPALFIACLFGCDTSGVQIGADAALDATPDAPIDQRVPDARLDADLPDAEQIPDAQPDAAPRTGPPLLGLPCAPGRAEARLIETVDPPVAGRRVVAAAGDAVLLNDTAAFVITRPDAGSTYYQYGGILADAFTIDGCVQANDDDFEELGLVIGQLSLADFNSSTLRAFKGERIEVLADGSDGGDAVVRVTGVDAPFWLVDYELQITNFEAVRRRSLSAPYGIRVQVDYILPPTGNVLTIEVTLINAQAEAVPLVQGAIMTFGDTQVLRTYNAERLSIGGFDLAMGIPWLGTGHLEGEAAYAYALEAANMAYTRISGVDVALDVNRVIGSPIRLQPAGMNGDRQTLRSFFAVGATDANSATRSLHAVNPRALPNTQYTPLDVAGRVVGPGGDPVPGATVLLEAENEEGWRPLEQLYTDADGRFAGALADFGDQLNMRFVVEAPGRDRSAPVPWNGATDIELTAPPAGRLAYSVLTPDGEPAPARVIAERDDGWRTLHYVLGNETHPLPPGRYALRFTRGIEYGLVDRMVDVPADGEAIVEAVMQRLLDTEGYLSTDSHVHSDPSSDSHILIVDRLRTAAATGLEIVIATDHEIVTDMADYLEPAGVANWVNQVPGLELTATVPEHLTVFPLDPDGSPRGGPVEWYQHDIDTLYALARDRGAEVVGLNHPFRGYLELIGWDVETAAPTLDDPTLLGLAPDAALWSWNFDAIEYQNDPHPIFQKADGSNIGAFETWQSFINAGHPITALGASDVHGLDGIGWPRTLFRAPTDDPTQFERDMLNDAILGGAAIVSSGAFMRVEHDDADIIGSLIDGADGLVEVRVQVQSLPEIDITRVVVFANCDQIIEMQAADLPPEGLDTVLKFDATIAFELEADAQITIMAFGEEPMPLGFEDYNPALTPRVTANPVYVDVDGNGMFDAPGPKACDHAQQRPR